VRLLSWNVNRRVGRLAEQAAAVGACAPDVVAFQEVTATTLPGWREALAAIGLPHVVAPLDAADPARAPAGPRRTGVLVAARTELRVSGAVRPLAPWPESVVAVETGGIHVVAAHVPNAANGWVKPHTLRALHDALAAAPGALRVVCGDLNTPRKETVDGEVWTFARDAHGRLRPERGEEWDAAERDVLLALPGMVDVFRALHGYAPRDLSWTWRRWRGGYRLDHVLASRELEPVACAYHHDWRTAGLSDHSAIEAELAGA
jgi:exonuclease III